MGLKDRLSGFWHYAKYTTLVGLSVLAISCDSGTKENEYECYSHSQCSDKEVCHEGSCLEKTGCYTDENCKDERVCIKEPGAVFGDCLEKGYGPDTVSGEDIVSQPDVIGEDILGQDHVQEDVVTLDTQIDTTQLDLESEITEGDIGKHCESNSDCKDFCYITAQVCSQECDTADDCPTEWDCTYSALDEMSVCTPGWMGQSQFGEPCSLPAECESGWCISTDLYGSVCTTACVGDADCPEDWECENVCQPESCTPDCYGKECGDDGCGDSCGDCGPSKQCNSGTCYGPGQMFDNCYSDTNCLSGICADGFTGTGFCSQGCIEDCFYDGLVCDSGECELPSPNNMFKDCNTDSDCGEGYECMEGIACLLYCLPELGCPVGFECLTPPGYGDNFCLTP